MVWLTVYIIGTVIAGWEIKDKYGKEALGLFVGAAIMAFALVRLATLGSSQ